MRGCWDRGLPQSRCPPTSGFRYQTGVSVMELAKSRWAFHGSWVLLAVERWGGLSFSELFTVALVGLFWVYREICAFDPLIIQGFLVASFLFSICLNFWYSCFFFLCVFLDWINLSHTGAMRSRTMHFFQQSALVNDQARSNDFHTSFRLCWAASRLLGRQICACRGL